MIRHGSPPDAQETDQAAHPPDMPALIAARICHDLISPLGAIGNGVELLELSKTAAGPELGLVRDSVHQAQARIRLFRIAFGAVGQHQEIGPDELRAILRDYSEQLRFELDWRPSQPLPKPLAKLALLALLCVETLLPHGGTAQVRCACDGIGISARSDRTQLEDALWQALDGAAPWPDNLRAAQVQFPALAAAIAAQKMMLDLTRHGDGLDLQITAD